jgi:hypothetical protein
MGELLIYLYDPATLQIDPDHVATLLVPLLGLILSFAVLI